MDDAGLEFSELFEGAWFVGKEIESGFRVSFDMNGSFMNPIINPVLGNIKRFCDLRYRKITGNTARMGLTAFLHDAMIHG